MGLEDKNQQGHSTPRFVLPKISENDSGCWGPAQDLLPAEFKDVPYAPFSKADKLGKIADWSNPESSLTGAQGYPGNQYGKDREGRGRRNYKDPYQAYGSAFASTFAYHHEEDEASFSMVDNRSAAVKKGVYGRTGNKTRGQNRGGYRGGQFQRLGGGQSDRGRGGARRRTGWRDYDKPQRVRNASIAVGGEWKVLEEMDFNRLSKLAYEEPEVEDLAWHGGLHYYDKFFDRISVKTEKPLQQSSKEHYNVTTSEDPVLQEFAKAGEGTIFATDFILSLLMSTTRSVYPWDIVVHRQDGKLFFDKREGGQCNFLSVNENATEPPVDAGEKENINSTAALSTEATYVNERFSEQVVKKDETVDMGKPNPFDESGHSQSCAYRYRKWVLGNESCVLVARTQLDAAVHASQMNQEDSYITVKALNEFDHKAPGAGGALDWHQKLDTQRGAVLATEMKNNALKLVRWACQGSLAGAEQIRIGFVSRVHPKDPNRHTILGTHSYKAEELASQMNFPLSNGWGIVKTISDMCLKLPDGKYILVKDPNKSILRLYSVPANAFDYDEEVEALEAVPQLNNEDEE